MNQFSVQFVNATNEKIAEKGMSHREFGNRIGWDSDTVSKVLDNRINLSMLAMDAMCQALECKVKVELEADINGST